MAWHFADDVIVKKMRLCVFFAMIIIDGHHLVRLAVIEETPHLSQIPD